VQLGLENKKQTMWAVLLGVVAIAVLAYEVVPMFVGSSTATASTESAVPPPAATHAPAHAGAKGTKKPRVENLDPTLRLDLLAASEQTQYEGSGINIFVSQREEVVIPNPVSKVRTDVGKNGGAAAAGNIYVTPTPSAPPPIPLKFYGFASTMGAAKKIFLKSGDGDVFVAGEGEIVDRRYKVVHITPTSVSIQDMVYSGPPQNIPLTQG
jgi:hypothetical protein